MNVPHRVPAILLDHAPMGTQVLPLTPPWTSPVCPTPVGVQARPCPHGHPGPPPHAPVDVPNLPHPLRCPGCLIMFALDPAPISAQARSTPCLDCIITHRLFVFISLTPWAPPPPPPPPPLPVSGLYSFIQPYPTHPTWHPVTPQPAPWSSFTPGVGPVTHLLTQPADQRPALGVRAVTVPPSQTGVPDSPAQSILAGYCLHDFPLLPPTTWDYRRSLAPNTCGNHEP